MTLRAVIAAIVVLGLTWHAALAMHELGHVLHAIVSGGGGLTLHVDLHPLRFSSTFVDPNPHPLFVVIGGPLWGCILSITIHVAATLASSRSPSTPQPHLRDFTRFLAAFCLILNGAYIGLGWVDRVGDAGDLLRLGAPTWALAATGIAAMIIGLWLLHQMGPRVGLPKLAAMSWPQHAILASAWLVLLVTEAILGTWHP